VQGHSYSVLLPYNLGNIPRMHLRSTLLSGTKLTYDRGAVCGILLILRPKRTNAAHSDPQDWVVR